MTLLCKCMQTANAACECTTSMSGAESFFLICFGIAVVGLAVGFIIHAFAY